MEAKDLRLGNYVRRKTINPDGIAEEYYEVLVVNSSTISKLEVGPILSRADGYTVFVEPIPLTEEWLLKFGFVRNKIKHEIGDFECHSIGDGKWNFVWDKLVFSASLKYVHTLQNLYFALTGEELSFDGEAKLNI